MARRDLTEMMTVTGQSSRMRSPVRRDHAENYLLTSLIAFAVTVIATRVFLELTGYPQMGNNVLHIAHSLWGGLLLFIAALLPVALANRWALVGSALLSGIGAGLFIDEVGKFITQANDYFFPPALSIIYGFFLLTLLFYVHFRRPRQRDSRQALYHVLEGLQDVLDGDLDTSEITRIESHLDIASTSSRDEVVSLADAIREYLHSAHQQALDAEPGTWRRLATRVDELGQRVGQRTHRIIVLAVLVLWEAFVIGYVLALANGGSNLSPQVVQWRIPLIAIQCLVGLLMLVAILTWLFRREGLSLQSAVGGFLLSLVALQTLYFYLSQFSAITSTLVQVGFLQILLAYRRWYLPTSSTTF